VIAEHGFAGYKVSPCHIWFQAPVQTNDMLILHNIISGETSAQNVTNLPIYPFISHCNITVYTISHLHPIFHDFPKNCPRFSHEFYPVVSPWPQELQQCPASATGSRPSDLPWHPTRRHGWDPKAAADPLKAPTSGDFPAGHDCQRVTLVIYIYSNIWCI